MGSRIRVSSNRIKSDADRIKELTDSIPTLMKELEQALYTLDGCWEGSAWNSFQTTNAYYIEVLLEVYKYYGEYVANLHQASQDYMRCEQDVMDKIDSWFV